MLTYVHKQELRLSWKIIIYCEKIYFYILLHTVMLEFGHNIMRTRTFAYAHVVLYISTYIYIYIYICSCVFVCTSTSYIYLWFQTDGLYVRKKFIAKLQRVFLAWHSKMIKKNEEQNQKATTTTKITIKLLGEKEKKILFFIYNEKSLE